MDVVFLLDATKKSLLFQQLNITTSSAVTEKLSDTL